MMDAEAEVARRLLNVVQDDMKLVKCVWRTGLNGSRRLAVAKP